MGPQALGRGAFGDLGQKIGQAIAGKQKEGRRGDEAAERVNAAAAAALHSAADATAGAADAVEAAAAAAEAASEQRSGGAAGRVPEAVRTARKAGAQQEVEYEEIEVEEPIRGISDYASDARALLTAPATRKGLAFGAAAFLGATFAVALYRVYLRSSTVEAQRRRTVDRNKQLVQGLSQFLPSKREELTPAVAKRLQRASGFTPVEAFRKYLWFVLRERKFDVDAVADMVALKGALALSDADVAEALRERSQRIYDKYGTLMLSTDGMSAGGLQRKATCRGLFSKMLYLTEHDGLVAHDSDAFKTTDLRMIFGATDDDADRLRIVSLAEMDAERLDKLMAGDAAGEGGGGGGSGGESS
ncbi:MAG: hypothetical protein J3K34DRAFT_469711 [Monoraphidium minutum]|nr:MAG: hypothetical protein J3K34DRAFT_469711 [Monoraphidium minutum]